jgi:hypothetical protein
LSKLRNVVTKRELRRNREEFVEAYGGQKEGKTEPTELSFYLSFFSTQLPSMRVQISLSLSDKQTNKERGVAVHELHQ